VHRPAFSVTFVAMPGVDGIKSFRALLKVALRRYGLRATDVRELHPAPTGSKTMSAFSDRIRSQSTGFFKVVDFEGGKEATLTISHLDEAVEMFDKEVDILNFVETQRQLQINQTNGEWLISNLGDEPATWKDRKVVLHLAEYTYNDKKGFTIRLKLPGAPALGDGQTRARPALKADRKDDLDDSIPF
jgi:hypothetical protein